MARLTGVALTVLIAVLLWTVFSILFFLLWKGATGEWPQEFVVGFWVGAAWVSVLEQAKKEWKDRRFERDVLLRRV